MMRLPETTRTPNGFTVEGASPELLGELLDNYARELKRTSPRIYGAMLPGLPKSKISDELGAIGIEPPEEVLVWWNWRNGFRPLVPIGLRHAQLRLEDAVYMYRRSSLGTDIDQWNPHWIHIAGSGNDGDAVCCQRSDEPPLVRAVSSFDIGTQPYEDPLRQVVSLCTPVTWWLLSIAKGWNSWDPITGFWGWDDSQYPLEWKLTNLM